MTTKAIRKLATEAIDHEGIDTYLPGYDYYTAIDVLGRWLTANLARWTLHQSYHPTAIEPGAKVWVSE